MSLSINLIFHIFSAKLAMFLLCKPSGQIVMKYYYHNVTLPEGSLTNYRSTNLFEVFAFFQPSYLVKISMNW